MRQREKKVLNSYLFLMSCQLTAIVKMVEGVYCKLISGITFVLISVYFFNIFFAMIFFIV